MRHLSGDIVGFLGDNPVPISIRYLPDVDPYAIKFIFFTPAPNEWIFSRDLLLDGLEVPSGEGDIHFDSDEKNVYMTIKGTSKTGNPEAKFAFIKADVQAIADIMLEMVPRGFESGIVDWDAELASILGE